MPGAMALNVACFVIRIAVGIFLGLMFLGTVSLAISLIVAVAAGVVAGASAIVGAEPLAAGAAAVAIYAAVVVLASAALMIVAGLLAYGADLVGVMIGCPPFPGGAFAAPAAAVPATAGFPWPFPFPARCAEPPSPPPFDWTKLLACLSAAGVDCGKLASLCGGTDGRSRDDPRPARPEDLLPVVLGRLDELRRQLEEERRKAEQKVTDLRNAADRAGEEARGRFDPLIKEAEEGKGKLDGLVDDMSVAAGNAWAALGPP